MLPPIWAMVFAGANANTIWALFCGFNTAKPH